MINILKYIYYNIYFIFNNIYMLYYLIISILIVVIFYVLSCNIRENFSENSFLQSQENYYKYRQQTPQTYSEADNFLKYVPNNPPGKQLVTYTESPLQMDAFNEVDEDVQKCKTLTDCGQLDGTSCGYCFSDNTFYYGDEKGPKANVCLGKWVTTSEECNKFKERNICSKVSNCNDMIGEASICAWCPVNNKAYPFKKQNGILVPKYTEDKCNNVDAVSNKNLGLISQENCGEFGKNHPCIGPTENTGPHSLQCLEYLWSKAGASNQGTNAPQNNQEQRNTWNKMGWKNVFDNMKKLVSNAKSNNWNIAEENYEKVYGKKLDPCSSSFSTTPVQCFQKLFKEKGCLQKGSGYPTTLNQVSQIVPSMSKNKYGEYITNTINDAHNQSSEYNKRNKAYEFCYGSDYEPRYIMYGPDIHYDRNAIPVLKIIRESGENVYLAKDGNLIKIVKEMANGNKENYYYEGEISQYGDVKINKMPGNAYNVKKAEKGNVVYLGCYVDKAQRALKVVDDTPMTYQQIYQKALQGNYRFFGLQDASDLGWNRARGTFGNDSYDIYGPSNNCQKLSSLHMAGGRFTNAVYEIIQ